MRNKRAVRVLAVILAALLVVSVFAGFFGLDVFGASDDAANNGGAAGQFDSEEFESALNFIRENYKDEIDTETLVRGAYRGMIEALEDPYSFMYDSAEEGERFVESVSGEYSGIGVGIYKNGGELIISRVLKDGPAYAAGIKEGDAIVSIDGKEVKDMDASEAAALLKGEEGSSVPVEISQGSGKLLRKVSLKRAKLRTECVFSELLEDDIGYIEITSFDSDCGEEFGEAFDELADAGMRALIVDVRGNPGGLIDQALRVVNKLVPERTDVMHYMQKGEIIKSFKSVGMGNSKYPAVLLINGQSASASEILAGALKDTNSATLIGTNTFGKGEAQIVVNAGEERSFKLSTYYFLTPNKAMIQGVGIAPDIEVKNDSDDVSVQRIAEYAAMVEAAKDSKPKYGDRDLNVYAAQQRLKFLGFPDINATGFFDEATLNAVKSFQRDSGLYAYGVLDYTTMEALEGAANRSAYGRGGEDRQLSRAIEFLSVKE